jgi:hypothetical protein
MTHTTKPPKVAVREWLDRRTHAPDIEPPPSPADIQRELGWAVVKDRAEVERE